MSPAPALVKFWQTDLTRECFLNHTTLEDRRALRLVCRDFAQIVAPILFAEICVSFGANSFTRPTRMAALQRIGHHCQKLTFSMPHSPNTFLPPLIDRVTGVEQDFVYQPRYQRPNSRSGDSKFGSWDVTDLLVEQYPPLFHPATNIPSFIQALEAMPRLRHLHISCPGQPSAQRYRRSVVDYALISLRIAIEQTPHPELASLTLSPIHPSSISYLRPLNSIGSLPNSPRPWRKITRLTIHMDFFPTISATDHLKHLHNYLQSFPLLTHLTFDWLSPTPSSSPPSPSSPTTPRSSTSRLTRKSSTASTSSTTKPPSTPSSSTSTLIPPPPTRGPCPLTLPTEPLLNPYTYLPTPVALPPTCPKTCSRPLRPLHFRHLTSLSLSHCLADASQIAGFIHTHRRTLRDAKFPYVDLRKGDWEEVGPLVRMAGRKGKADRERGMGKGEGKGMGEGEREYGDIPIQISAEDLKKGRMMKKSGEGDEETVDFFPADEEESGGGGKFGLGQRRGWRVGLGFGLVGAKEPKKTNANAISTLQRAREMLMASNSNGNSGGGGRRRGKGNWGGSGGGGGCAAEWLASGYGYGYGHGHGNGVGAGIGMGMGMGRASSRWKGFWGLRGR